MRKKLFLKYIVMLVLMVFRAKMVKSKDKNTDKIKTKEKTKKKSKRCVNFFKCN